MRTRRGWLYATVAVAAGAAGAVVLAFVLVIVPLLNAAGGAVNELPGQLGHSYVNYWNGVTEQLQQAQQHSERGQP